MNYLARIFCTIFTISVCGCAIHPLPEDVTGVSTNQIVRQIRCETRQAVIDSTLEYLTAGDGVDKRSRDIGLHYLQNQQLISELDPKLFQGPVHDILNLFWTTGVAYNYKLEMTEINNLDSELNFLRTFTNGMVSLGVKSGLDRTRQNTRTFTITDTFKGLVQKIPPGYCTGKLVGENQIYPITGKIGIDGMVHAFVYLSLFNGLSGKEVSPTGPPTLVDALTFTTMISGSATPKVTFTPVGRGLNLSNASLTAEANRKDVHGVTVGLALDKVSVPQLDPVRGALIGRLLTASGSRAELAAAAAVDQFLTQKLFSPTIIVNP